MATLSFVKLSICTPPDRQTFNEEMLGVSSIDGIDLQHFDKHSVHKEMVELPTSQ